MSGRCVFAEFDYVESGDSALENALENALELGKIIENTPPFLGNYSQNIAPNAEIL